MHCNNAKLTGDCCAFAQSYKITLYSNITLHQSLNQTIKIKLYITRKIVESNYAPKSLKRNQIAIKYRKREEWSNDKARKKTRRCRDNLLPPLDKNCHEDAEIIGKIHKD
jgi:hypothetical protein